jgi:hypothetical protein
MPLMHHGSFCYALTREPTVMANTQCFTVASAAWDESQSMGDWSSVPMSKSLIGKALRLRF